MYCTQAVVSSVRKEHSAEYFWLDGGSTHHVVSSKDMLYDHTGSHVSSVLVAGGEKHEVSCEGKLWLDTDNGPVILCGVLLVPSFEVNLCSEGRLADKGLYIVKTSTTATVRDSKTREEVINGTRQNDLYRLNCTIRRPSHPAALVATAHVLPDVPLFHRRLGHPSVKATKKLLLSNAVIGVDQTAGMQLALPTGTCLICQKGKATRASFPQSRHRASAPCALIHSDLMGPFTAASIGGAVYVVTFIDDFSGYGEAIPIKRKTDVYDELQQVLARWQRQSGYQVKRIRSDRGTEYKGQIAAYLRSEGIVHETSTAYTPEQNGRAERFNRTILDRVRCMLAEFELPTILWGEAVVYAAYCRNYMPMQGQTESPIELMFSVKPSVSHLRVFGCQAIRTVPRHQRDKTDCPGEQCVFVGCAANSKAWRLLRMKGNTPHEVVESIHCTFNEDVSGFMYLRRDQRQIMENDYQLMLNDSHINDTDDGAADDEDDEDTDPAHDQNVHDEDDNQQVEAETDDDSVYGDIEIARRSTRQTAGCLQTDWSILQLQSSISDRGKCMQYVKDHMTSQYQLITL
jgi:transposase InsO family protein